MKQYFIPITTPWQQEPCKSANPAPSNVVLSPGAVNFPFGYARSAAEARRANDESKYRQLPCRTFISSGTCPYRERCVYLHDPRIMSKDAKSKTRRKNKEDIIFDSLFWPVMSVEEVNRRKDSTGQPQVIQPYHVPAPKNDQYRRHDECVFSLWMHFVEFCSANSRSPMSSISTVPTVAKSFSDDVFNNYTRRPRLQVFVSLSHGDIIAEEVRLSDTSTATTVAKMKEEVVVGTSKACGQKKSEEPNSSENPFSSPRDELCCTPQTEPGRGRSVSTYSLDSQDSMDTVFWFDDSHLPRHPRQATTSNQPSASQLPKFSTICGDSDGEEPATREPVLSTVEEAEKIKKTLDPLAKPFLSPTRKSESCTSSSISHHEKASPASISRHWQVFSPINSAAVGSGVDLKKHVSHPFPVLMHHLQLRHDPKQFAQAMHISQQQQQPPHCLETIDENEVDEELYLCYERIRQLESMRVHRACHGFQGNVF